MTSGKPNAKRELFARREWLIKRGASGKLIADIEGHPEKDFLIRHFAKNNGLKLAPYKILKNCERCGTHYWGNGQTRYCKGCRAQIAAQNRETYFLLRTTRAAFVIKAKAYPMEARRVFEELCAEEGTEYANWLLGNIYRKFLAGEELFDPERMPCTIPIHIRKRRAAEERRRARLMGEKEDVVELSS